MFPDDTQAKDRSSRWAMAMIKLATASAILGIGCGILAVKTESPICIGILLGLMVLTFGFDRLAHRFAKHAGITLLLLVAVGLLLPANANAQWQTKAYHARQSTGTNTAQATVNIKQISPNDPGWKTEFLRVLNADKNRLAEAQRQAEENATYLQALNALGYPTSVQGGSVAQSSAYGGQSIYGYSYSTVADYWNAADRNVLANQAYNTTNRAIDLADKWQGNMSGLYAQEIEAQTRMAEAVSGRDLAVAVLEGAALVAEKSKQSRTRIETTQQAFGPGGQPIGNPPPAPRQADFQALAMNACAKCHSGQSPPKGIILDGSSPLSIDHYTASVRAVDRGTMPPPDSNVILTQDEQDEVIAGLKQLLGN